MAPVFEYDLTIVKYNDEYEDSRDYVMTDYYTKDDGEWVIKPYVPLCKFRILPNCDRIKFKEELEEGLYKLHVCYLQIY